MLSLPEPTSFGWKKQATAALIGTFILVGAGLAETARAGEAATGRIVGAVRQAGTLAPLAGAQVTAAGPLSPNVPPTIRTTHTNEQGFFGFDGLPPGFYVLEAAAPGFYPARSEVSLAPGAIVERVFRLEPQILGGGIRGRVMDAADQRPIARARIYYGQVTGVLGEPEWWLHPDSTILAPFVVADAEGRYEIGGLPPGGYHLLAVAEGYEPQHRSVTVESGRIAEADFSLVSFEPPEPGGLAGRVTDAATWAPIAGALMFLRRVSDDLLNSNPSAGSLLGDLDPGGLPPPWAVTDKEGFYAIAAVPPGLYHLLAVAEGYQARGRLVEVHSGEVTEADLALLPLTGADGSIFGRVRDARTEAPIAEADVWAILDGEVVIAGVVPTVVFGPTKTDAEGRYRLERVPAGSVIVLAAKDGYYPARQQALVLPLEATEVNLRLLPRLTGHGAVAGVVRDALTGEPLPRAVVSVSPGDGFDGEAPTLLLGEAVTDDLGRYRIGPLPAGPVRVTAHREGYHPQTRSAGVFPEQTTQVDFALEPLTKVHGALHGRVRDGGTGQPLPAARVWVTLENPLILGAAPIVIVGRTETDAEGRYRIENLPAGAVRVFAAKEGYSLHYRDVSIPPGGDLELNFVLFPIGTGEGSIFGRVVDAREGRPLGGAVVWVTSAEELPILASHPVILFGRAVTDELGRYRIDGLPVGPVRVFAVKEGYRLADRRVSVPAGEATEVNFELQPIPVLETGHIAGVVRDAVTLEPLAEVLITLLPDDEAVFALSQRADLVATAVTDAEGRFGFRDVPAGRYRLQAARAGYEPAVRPAWVEPGTVTRVDFLLLPLERPDPGALAGQVRHGETGEPLAGAWVRLFPAGHGWLAENDALTTRTNEAGRYAFARLRPGPYQAIAGKHGFEPAAEVVFISSGGRVELDFDLRPVTAVGAIEGRVADARTDEPIAGALVFVPLLDRPHSASPDTALYARTNDRGLYRIEGVPAGERLVVAFERAYYPLAQVVLVSAGETVRLDFALLPRTSSGQTWRFRCLEVGTGEPVAGARVHLPLTRWVEPGSAFDPWWGRSDSDGIVEIEGVPADGGPLLASAEGYLARATTLAEDAAPSNPARAGLNESPIEMTILLEREQAANAVRAWLLYR